jgi:hypothetical protein
LSLQHLERHFARVFFCATSIVEENTARFLAQGYNKFSSRATAVRACKYHGIGLLIAYDCS